MRARSFLLCLCVLIKCHFLYTGTLRLFQQSTIILQIGAKVPTDNKQRDMKLSVFFHVRGHRTSLTGQSSAWTLGYQRSPKWGEPASLSGLLLAWSAPPFSLRVVMAPSSCSRVTTWPFLPSRPAPALLPDNQCCCEE